MDLKGWNALNQTMSLDIFVIFHVKIFEKLYKELDEDELKYLTFVAVNEKTNQMKDATHFRGRPIIKEWELPEYNPEWQKNNWWIGGVVHHLVMNRVSNADYIGMVQHDFTFEKGSIHRLVNMLRPNTAFTIKTMNMLELVGTSTFGFHEFDLYNLALSQLPPLRVQSFPIYHNCFMERKKYEEMMPALLKADKLLFAFHNRPGDPVYRFPITSERTLALAIGGVVDEVVEIKGITHLQSIDDE